MTKLQKAVLDLSWIPLNYRQDMLRHIAPIVDALEANLREAERQAAYWESECHKREPRP